MSNEISRAATWELEKIEKATTELRKEIRRLETALDESCGVVQQLIPYPLEKVIRQTNQKSYGSPDSARKAAEHAYQDSLSVVQQNRHIVATNERIKARLIEVITNAGLPKTVSVRRARSRYKWDSVDTDWYSAVSRHIPTNDQWPLLQDSYKSWLSQCDSWERQINEERASKERAAREEKRKVDVEIFRRAMVAKYGLDADSGMWAVRDKILSANKYLRLAHYLQLNRGDWSDGCDFARQGLREFTVEYGIDREIVDEVRGFCDDWDGDGRVFRDCNWNYTRLFEMVEERSADLMADYRKLEELAPQEEW